MKQKRLTVKVDPHTYSDSKAGETLAKILNEKYPQCVERVGAYYHRYTTDLRGFSSIWDKFPRGTLLDVMSMHRAKHLNKVQVSSLPEEIKSYLLNVMQKQYRVKLIHIKHMFKLCPNI